MLQVLIVDDDNVVVFIQKKMVFKHEIAESPLCFNKGEDALEYLYEQQDSDNFFLVLLDINMPGMNGWTFLEEIRNHSVNEKVYVVLVTSSVDFKDKEKAFRYSNVVDFLEKPISSQDCERIKNLPQIAEFFQNQD